MSVFTCISNAFTGKSNCPNNCDRILRDCKEERARLVENNNILTNDNQQYITELNSLSEANTALKAEVTDLKARLAQAEEAVTSVVGEGAITATQAEEAGDAAKETFIGSLSTVASVFVVIVIVFAVGVLLFLAYMFWRKRSRTRTINEQGMSGGNLPSGLLD